jgi:DNA repair exonuclease SbcCD ATPase subunit
VTIVEKLTILRESAMIKYSHLVEQHIVEFESRLKHIDELLTRANEGVKGEQQELATELKELTVKREELAGHLEEIRHNALEEQREKEIEKAGPMGIWDAVAQQLEKLIERLGR